MWSPLSFLGGVVVVVEVASFGSGILLYYLFGGMDWMKRSVVICFFRLAQYVDDLTVRLLKMQSICFQPRLMEKQEARRRAAKPKIREQSPEAHPRVKRKGEELYYDEAGNWMENLYMVILCPPPGRWVGVIFELIERRCLRAGEDLQEVPEGLDFSDPAGHCAEDPRGNTGKGRASGT